MDEAPEAHERDAIRREAKVLSAWRNAGHRPLEGQNQNTGTETLVAGITK